MPGLKTESQTQQQMKETHTAAEHSARLTVVVTILAALAVLVFGTYRAYQSAYGDPSHLDQMSSQPLAGLATRFAAARNRVAKDAQAHLRHAVIATLAAVALLAIAIGLTWFAPPVPQTVSSSVCILVQGKLVAKIASSSVAVKTLSPGTELRQCP